MGKLATGGPSILSTTVGEAVMCFLYQYPNFQLARFVPDRWA